MPSRDCIHIQGKAIAMVDGPFKIVCFGGKRSEQWFSHHSDKPGVFRYSETVEHRIVDSAVAGFVRVV